MYDGYDAITSAFPKSLLNALDEGDSKFVNSTITALMESDPNTRFNVKHGMWTTGSNSPYDLITGAKNYTLKDIIKNITCIRWYSMLKRTTLFQDNQRRYTMI